MRAVRISFGPFNKEAYKIAQLEAILNPPKAREMKRIGGELFIWYEGKWRWPTPEEKHLD